MSFGILMPEIEHGKSTDQKSADVPSGDLISREEAMKAVYLLGKRPKTNEIWDCLDALPSADRPTLKQTDTMIIADALRYLIKDTERHEIDRTRAEELREQFLKYGASMCHSADRPKGEWEKIIVRQNGWYCSNCGKAINVDIDDIYDWHYCPRCGSHNLGGEKDENIESV